MIKSVAMANKGEKKLTHLGDDGVPRMVDVAEKAITRRTAVASGRMRLSPAALKLISEGAGKKGSAVGVATIAAINGAKKTSDLVPLCHPLPLDRVNVDFRICERAIECEVEVSAEARTGVEMEALTAVHVGLLCLYDMCKSIDRKQEITSIRLVSKTGGSSEEKS